MKNNYLLIGIAVIITLTLLGFALYGDGTTRVSTASPVTAERTVLLSFGKFNYDPETITAKKGVPITIKADLKRITGCYQTFMIPELGISGTFTEAHDSITFVPDKVGTFLFTCSMGMGRGTLIVEP